MSNKPRDYFPEHAADLPQIEYLPDLFEFFDGTRVKSPQGWIERREELRDLMQYYLYGYMHETPESASRFRALSEAEKEERTVEFSFPGMPQPFKIRPEALVEVTDRGVTAGITLDAFRVPQYGVDTEYRAPYPAVICVGSLSEAQQNTLLQNGYAYIAMNTGSVYSDGGNNPRTGAYCELYPYVAGDYEFD
ncbi:MAG: hypothetical protein LBN02_04025, partial [Oscillospiraceae bacterium]|nr:hypothetical protein [Oscillospiraceae bacterium]